MKIVEYSKGSITEVENVFKVVESGAQGPQGEPGTIGTLDLLDPKTTPVDADLMLVGDSAASFANKKITWANIKAAFNLLYQPLSSALSKITEAGGLPLWDGAAWPGGGGGGEWTDIASATVTTPVTSIDFEDVFTDDYNVYELLIYGGSVSATGQLVLRLGSGITPVYTSSLYSTNGLSVTPSSALYTSVVSVTRTYITYRNASIVSTHILNGNMLLFGLRTAGVAPTWRGFGSQAIPTSYADGLKLDTYGMLDNNTTIFDHLRIGHSTTGGLSAGTYILRGKNV